MRFLRLILLFILFCALVNVGLGAPIQQGNTHRLGKVNTIDTDKFFDGNNMKMWVTNTGSFAWDVTTGNPGLIFPKGTDKTAIFASGLWLGAKVNNQIRVAISEYSDEYVPGPMKDSTFQPDQDRFHVYKINRGDNSENNADYKDWPIQDGAPFEVVNGDTVPKIYGDQTLWTVYNDADPSAHTNNSGSTSPLGVEVQITVFGFNRIGALGNTVFLKYRIINKGPNTLDSTFVALWSDPDLGDAMDDLVGCDTTLSVGFVYNATNNDNVYHATPPCVGYDFFQGPIVPGSPDDTAWVSGEPRPGYKNLPMTAFNKYINGTDPTNSVDSYNYMKGLDAVEGGGAPYVDPVTGDVTTYAMSGDPVTGKGWLDSNPADRRFLTCSGPFTMAPGDTQEVVAAIVIGDGKDRLTSITLMKFYDSFAQSAFDANFELPNPPDPPVVVATPLNEEVVLTWGDISEVNHGDYPFEGYNVYQGASVAGPWKRIATYDVNNGVGIIFDNQFDLESGVVINKPVQYGSDTGLKHFFEIAEDYIRGGPLHNGTPYYFAVTAYSYDDAKAPKTLENPPAVIILIPQTPVGGTDYSGVNAPVIHTAGSGDNGPIVRVVDPKYVTGHTYTFSFTQPDTSVPDLVWYFVDATPTLPETLLKDQTDYSGTEYREIFDGLLIRMTGSFDPPTTFESGVQIKDADTSDAGLELWGDATLFGNSTGRASEFYGGGDSNSVFLMHDLELRFTGVIADTVVGEDTTIYVVSGGSWASMGKVFGSDNPADYELVRIPFEVWDVDKGANRQVNCVFYDRGHHEITWEIENRDYIIPVLSDYDSTILRTGADPYATWLLFFTTTSEWSTGDKFRVNYSNPLAANDIFTLPTQRAIENDVSLAKKALENVRAVPNPYFNSSTYEPDQFHRVIKFINLPSKCTIRIFTLAGDLVRVLSKDDPVSSILEWDVKTSNNLPVASGIYIYYIEAEGIGSKTGKMAIFTEKERLITY